MAEGKERKLAKAEVKECWTCGYKEELPGSCHISCTRLFGDVQPPKAKSTKYYLFPFNFDPIWQEEKCKGWAKERDPKKTKQFSPLERVFGLLGRRVAR